MARKPPEPTRKAARPRREAPARPRRRRGATGPVTDAGAGDLRPVTAPVLGDIPWTYGDVRVTAMARDPRWLFVYWELSDEAIARARSELGTEDGDVVLRVYDTTFRHFDGSNAHWHVDVAVHRPANNHYVHVGAPGATLHVDAGVRSDDGRFATIVRSAPVELPRDALAPAGEHAEWMTVHHGREWSPPYAHGRAARAEVLRERPSEPESEIDRLMQSLVGEGWSRTEWSERDLEGHTVRWRRWMGPFQREVWRWAGGDAPASVEIRFEGVRRVVRFGREQRVLFGPWHVTISGPDPSAARRVLDEWSVRYSWVMGPGTSGVETAAIIRRILEGYRAPAATASEARFGGEAAAEAEAQAAVPGGASEGPGPAGGASERWPQGASGVGLAGGREPFADATWLFGASGAGLRPGQAAAAGSGESGR